MKKNLEVVRNFCNHLFDVYDADDSNGLDSDEVTLLLKDICVEYQLPKMTDDQILDVIQKFDTDGNGVFDREELFAIVEPLFTSTQQHDCKIDLKEIKRKLKEINITLEKKKGGFIPGLKALLAEKQNWLELLQNLNKRQSTIMENFAKQFLNHVTLPPPGNLSPLPQRGHTPATPIRDLTSTTQTLTMIEAFDPGPTFYPHTPDIDFLNQNGIKNSQNLLPFQNLTHPNRQPKNF